MEHQDYTSVAQGAAEKATGHAQEIAAVTAKATPPMAVTGMHLAGYPLADWLVLATLVYTVLQVIVLLHRLYLQHINRCDIQK